MNFICSHGLEHLHFCELLWETERKYPDLLKCQQQNALIVVKFYCSFIVLQAVTEIFLNKNFPHPLLSNNKWFWKLIFASVLIMFLNKSNLKSLLFVKPIPISEIFWCQFESQLMSSCFINSSHFQKSKKETVSSPF